jgi:hypothetical protein
VHACLPAKNAGLALADPVESADANLQATEFTNSHIIQVTRGEKTFSLRDHIATSSKVKAELKKQKDEQHKNALTRLLAPLPIELSHTIRRGCETWVCLTVIPSTIAGTELPSYEFCDSLHTQYGRTSAGQHPKRDGCGASFDTGHVFSCAKDGLVIIRRNRLRDELCDMTTRAFQPSVVRDEPHIHCVAPPKPESPVLQ